MYNTNDDILINYRPGRLSESEYKMDLESVIANGAYHSDEVSEMDDEKTQKEINDNIRPKNKEKADHYMILVYDKPWRFRRVNK